MARNTDRDRRARDQQSDWDWDYYYEYRYTPRDELYGRDYYDRDRDRDYYGRYGRDYDRPYGDSYYAWLYPYHWVYPYGRTYGEYYGVGPSSYQRSDERIRDDINDRLTYDGRIDASDINVDVNDGIVTLTGSVDSRWDKRMAEDDSDDVLGVVDVNNQLRVRNKRSSRTTQGAANRDQIRPGLEVVDRDGKHIGEVKEVRTNDFLVDRPMAFDVYVPFDACSMSGGQVRLDVRSDQLENQGWEMPEKMPVTDKKKR